MIERYVRWLLRHRRVMLVFFLVSIGVSIYSARRIRVRFDTRDFFYYKGNPDVDVIDRYDRYFQDPAMFVGVLVEADDVFQTPVLRYIEQLTATLEPESMFSHVRTLVNARVPRARGDEVDVGSLMPVVPPPDLEGTRKIALSSPLLVHRIVSDDSKATVVAAQLRDVDAVLTIDKKRVAVDLVRKLVAQVPVPAGVRVRVTGAPVLDVEGSNALVRNQRIFTPAAVLLILTALFLTFRSVHGVLLPLAAVVTALIWTFGIFAMFGRPIDFLTTMVPSTLLVYGGVDPIFVLSRFLEKLKAGRDRERAILESFNELAMPCFLTSFTTAIGFFAFATLKLQMIVAYGATIGIGVTLAWVTTMTVLPVLLATLPLPRVADHRALYAHPAIDRGFQWAWRGLWKHRRMVAIVTVILTVVGTAIATQQHVSVFYTGVLPAGDALDAVRVLENKLTGPARAVVFLEGAPGQMRQPEVVAAIGRIDAAAEKHRIVTKSLSVADIVAEENQAFNGGDLAERRLPTSANLIAQYLTMLHPDERADYVTDDYARAHIRVSFSDAGSEAFRPLRDDLLAAMQKEMAPFGIRAYLTGKTALGYQAIDKLVIEMIYGHFIGFSLIVLVILLVFRSPRIALISILPNLLPAIACFAVLALAHITLRLGTALFLGVSLGGLFNTTIQFCARVRQLARTEKDPDRIIEESIREVGPPALFTAAILSASFAIFMLGSTPDVRAFGLLAMTILSVGFVSDAVLTSTLMRRFYNWGKKNDESSRLDRDDPGSARDRQRADADR